MVSDRPKRCWNCGFLYAILRSGRTARDAIVDPDELRNEAIMDELTRVSQGSPDSSDTQVAAIGILEKPISGLPYDAADGPLAFPAWKDIISFQCLWQKFDPLMLGFLNIDERVKKFSSLQERDNYRARVVRQTAGCVLRELYETDRSQCPYFPYRPGFSAKEHAELQLADIRMRREEAFQQMAMSIQSSLQSRAIQQQKIQNWITLGLLIATILSSIATIILALQRQCL